jgi:hypothetical protein
MGLVFEVDVAEILKELASMRENTSNGAFQDANKFIKLMELSFLSEFGNVKDQSNG